VTARLFPPDKPPEPLRPEPYGDPKWTCAELRQRELELRKWISESHPTARPDVYNNAMQDHGMVTDEIKRRCSP
jgi:hypothetical protein